ncbi:MAG: peptide chain release factor N(5)-glutamine methyltransferase [Erythrobacter sp.]
MSVSDAIRRAAEQLSQTSGTARLDAELLMAHALEVSRSDLLLKHMQAEEPAAFQPLVARRAHHEPVGYIIGTAEFYGREFAVGPGVLIPRSDSEVLIDAALKAVPNPKRVLDMGAGSGALLFTILAEIPAALGIGMDRSADAIQTAQKNAGTLKIGDRIGLLQRDWGNAGWDYNLPRFDLILCNPPYVETAANLEPDVRDFEPAEALFAGSDGMDDYKVILPQLAGLLNPDGAAVLEIGHKQGEAVQALARQHGFASELRQDLGGRDRCVILRQNG